MPLDLTPEQREKFAATIGHDSWCHHDLGCCSSCTDEMRDCDVWATVDDLAPVVAQMLADERERIAREIETTAAEHEAEDKAEGCTSRYCAGWLLGQKHAASIARTEPACSCPTDAEIRAAIHHSHQQLTGGNK